MVLNDAQVGAFLALTARFDAIMSILPEEFRDENLAVFDIKLQEKRHRAAIIQYYNLLSEEQYLNTNGVIADDLWREWLHGAREIVNVPAFKSKWEKIKDQYPKQFVDLVGGLFRKA